MHFPIKLILIFFRQISVSSHINHFSDSSNLKKSSPEKVIIIHVFKTLNSFDLCL